MRLPMIHSTSWYNLSQLIVYKTEHHKLEVKNLLYDQIHHVKALCIENHKFFHGLIVSNVATMYSKEYN